MNRTFIAIFALLALNSQAFASGTTAKQVDAIQNSTGGAAIAVPGVGSVFDTDTSTVTLSNKTISGSANTLSNIPVSALASGTAIGVGLGGTGDTTLPSAAILIGNGTSAVTGLLGTANGQVATWNGSAWAAVAPAVMTPALNGSQASPQSVTATSGVALSGIGYSNFAFISASASGTTTVTAVPSVSACTAAGQTLVLVGESATNLVKLQDQSVLTGSALALNGNWTSGLNSTLSLACDGNGIWVETARQK